MSGRLDPLHLKGEPSLSLIDRDKEQREKTVEKVQVPVAMCADRFAAPLPQPVLIVSSALEGALQTFTVWRMYSGEFYPKNRFTWKSGELSYHRADLISATVGDFVYNFLVTQFGVVQTLEESMP